jgi:hypothetical protein
LVNFDVEDESLCMVSGSDLHFPLYEKMLDLLGLWSADLDSKSTARIDSMTDDQMNEILMRSAEVENNIAIIHIQRSHFNLVETHCQRGLFYARLYEGTEDKKTGFLCAALRTFSDLQSLEGNYADIDA